MLSKNYKILRVANYKPQFNSSTKDEWIATQGCSTGVTKVGIKKNKNYKIKRRLTVMNNRTEQTVH